MTTSKVGKWGIWCEDLPGDIKHQKSITAVGSSCTMIQNTSVLFAARGSWTNFARRMQWLLWNSQNNVRFVTGVFASAEDMPEQSHLLTVVGLSCKYLLPPKSILKIWLTWSWTIIFSPMISNSQPGKNYLHITTPLGVVTYLPFIRH